MNVAELEGPALDWAVAQACGYDAMLVKFGPLFGKGYYAPMIDGYHKRFAPSTEWEIGGKLVEHFELSVQKWRHTPSWVAQFSAPRVHSDGVRRYGRQAGPTLLIAAMRLLAEWKFGAEVDVPKLLLTR